MAIGREARTAELGLESVGVNLSPKNKKMIVSDSEQSNIPHIYGVGDILDDKPELTPVAIQAGRLLSKRLFGRQKAVVSTFLDCLTARPVNHAAVLNDFTNVLAPQSYSFIKLND